MDSSNNNIRSSNTPDANFHPEGYVNKNPLFQHVHRAPYEYSRLMHRLPAKCSPFEPQTDESYMIADAIASHASNALGTVVSGLQALGAVLMKLGCEGESGISSDQLRDLGGLIQHLAVEAELYDEEHAHMRSIVVSRQSFMAQVVLKSVAAKASRTTAKKGGAK